MQLTGNYLLDSSHMDQALNLNRAFDLTKREFVNMKGAKCALYAVSGLIKDTVLTETLNFFMRFDGESEKEIAAIPYIETANMNQIEDIKNAVLKGGTAILRDHCQNAAIVYARSYPMRGIEEPENDKVLRGSRDGFGESLILNTSLIRRRIRDANLCIENMIIGASTRTDVAVCYVDGLADDAFLNTIKNKLNAIDTDSLNMGAESIAEMLIKKRWYNPFPKIRYTERPDTVCAHLLEGSIIILCDNYPAAMILPTSIFDFIQETDDFYFPPLVGSYLRIIRIIIVLMTLYLLPVWALIQSNPDKTPELLKFIIISNEAQLPLLFQIFIAEIAIDGLKLASLNTPSMLGNSLSVVAGLILSDFAVAAGWFEPGVVLYVAITALGTFTQVSYELGFALKFMRLFMFLCASLFGLWGFIISDLLMKILIVINKGVGGRGYLYPLIPFNGNALKRLLIRTKKTH
ncbi:MAG: spore germination protein [Clostridiales bacterium]|nr:spore germination protein [Clostridiales bacterium]